MEGRSQERRDLRASPLDKRRIDRTSTSLVFVESRCHVLAQEHGLVVEMSRLLRLVACCHARRIDRFTWASEG
jgi:hypothetical protein